MSNVPDDWGAYGGTCSECGHYWHASGTYECKCVETFRCEKQLPWGQCDEEVEDEDELTKTVDSESWCSHCVSEHAFTCDVCDEVFPNEHCANTELTMDKQVCTYCDEQCATDKTHHHTPVGISIAHLEYILWTMENAAKDKPYEGTQPGNAKKWLKESIDLIKKSMPDPDHEATNDAMDALSESMNPVGGK